MVWLMSCVRVRNAGISALEVGVGSCGGCGEGDQGWGRGW